MATQKSHSGLSTCRVKSVGKHMGTAGLNKRKRSQQVKTAVSMWPLYFSPINRTCMGKKNKPEMTKESLVSLMLELFSALLIVSPVERCWCLSAWWSDESEHLCWNVFMPVLTYANVIWSTFICPLSAICDQKGRSELPIHYIDDMNEWFLCGNQANWRNGFSPGPKPQCNSPPVPDQSRSTASTSCQEMAKSISAAWKNILCKKSFLEHIPPIWRKTDCCRSSSERVSIWCLVHHESLRSAAVSSVHMFIHKLFWTWGENIQSRSSYLTLSRANKKMSLNSKFLE